VSFEGDADDVLDKVDSVGADHDEPQPVEAVCTESQCETQRKIMIRFFDHFQLPFDHEKHKYMW